TNKFELELCLEWFCSEHNLVKLGHGYDYSNGNCLFEQHSAHLICEIHYLKDRTSHFACLSLIYSIFIHITLLTTISQRIKPYFSFPDILQNLLIFRNQIFNSFWYAIKINLLILKMFFG
ncbi:hypothetical protein LDENG_00252210, partial [Lucifuga dentata]